MARLKVLILLIALTSVGAIALNGAAPFGRIMLSLGYPALAESMLKDPVWKGIALYRQGKFEAAVEMLREAGPEGYFYRANALARLGRYVPAVEVIDAHIYRIPNDTIARENREVFAELGKVVGEGRDGQAGMPVALLVSAEKDALQLWREQGGRKKFSDQAIIASQQWLTTLPDEPGLYMKLRIAAEQEQRILSGNAMPPADSPW